MRVFKFKPMISVCLSAAITWTAALGGAIAQTAPAWPTKPITLINPFPAGGPTDDIARWLAKQIEGDLGQPIVVTNVPGAGGSVGMQRVSQSRADGYTLGFAHIGTHVLTPILYAKVGYDPIKDFTPIGIVAEYSNLLVANANSPYKKLEDIIAAAKAKPGAISYGSAGNGSSNHLNAEMLAQMADIKLTHVPYRGSLPAMTDMIGGVFPFMFDVMTATWPHIESGKLRVLAVTSKERHPKLPNVPTIAEFYPGYSFVGWVGLVAPAGIPAPVAAKLTDIVKAKMALPEAKAFFESRGLSLQYKSPREFTEAIRNDLSVWTEVVKKSGARVE